jgi:membrane protein
MLRASALAYVTVISIVPFLAVAFSISKGLGFQNTEYIQDFLMRLTAGREVVVQHIINYINRTNVATLGGLGVGILFLTVFSLLGAIEKTFNTIWGIKQPRTISRKFADYLSVTLVSPLLIIVSISFTASLQSITLVQKILSFSVMSYVYLAFLKFMPFLLVWLALLFIYKFIPNTTVQFRSALGGAIVAGTLWQLIQLFFLHYQIGLSRYNAIYGSFAQVPLFLVWLYISWVIVLIGAEVNYSLQYYRTSVKESTLGNFDLESKEKLALTLYLLLAKSFESGRPLLSTHQLALLTNNPVKIINNFMHMLMNKGYVVKAIQDSEEGYTPAFSPGSISLLDFIQDIRSFKEKGQGFALSRTFPYVDNIYAELQETARQSSMNLSIKELAQEFPVELEQTEESAET